MKSKERDFMNKKLKTIAFDFGGVLAYQDLSTLTEEELFLLQTFMNRNHVVDRDLLEYAQSKIAEIYLKIHKLNGETIPTLELLQQDKIRSSIWTNNVKEIEAWFEEVDLYRYIRKEDIINSFYLGFDKPNIEFYRRALLFLKNNPGDVLFFDDNHANILGAKKCGINSKEYDMKESLKETIESEIRKRRK